MRLTTFPSLLIVIAGFFYALTLQAAESNEPLKIKPADAMAALENYKKAHQGQVIYLDFWASWCVPCRRSFPWMNEMKARFHDKGLTIIAVNLDKQTGQAEKFLEQYPAQFDLLFDPQNTLAKHYQIPGMPSSLLIDRNGQIIKAHSGFFIEKIDTYQAEIEQAIGL